MFERRRDGVLLLADGESMLDREDMSGEFIGGSLFGVVIVGNWHRCLRYGCFGGDGGVIDGADSSSAGSAVDYDYMQS
jgi:hypothetical protein